jgi:hypothetical protein
MSLILNVLILLGFINFWIDVANNFSSIVEGIGKVIKSGFTSALQFVTDLWNNAIEGFAIIGKSIGDAILNGLKSAYNGIVSFLNTLPGIAIKVADAAPKVLAKAALALPQSKFKNDGSGDLEHKDFSKYKLKVGDSAKNLGEIASKSFKDAFSTDYVGEISKKFVKTIEPVKIEIKNRAKIISNERIKNDKLEADGLRKENNFYL